jgi:hypothetical protein
MDKLLPELVEVDRRTTLRWFAVFAAAPLAACGETARSAMWGGLKPISAPTIGRDPNMLKPTVPWPLTMTRAERLACAALSDLILPAEAGASSASQAGVPAFIDEWISAPYETQQAHRDLIVPGLAWLDEEAKRRGGSTFAASTPAVQASIADDIAYAGKIKPGMEKPAAFFARMRSLTLGAYYTTPEGWKQIGYVGNRPYTGPYKGPTPEAMADIKRRVEAMGLTFV